MTIKSTVETITPAIAEAILEDSKEDVRNRNVSDHHVEWLASQMQAGRWTLNGESIIVDEEGKLLDGQHRLWAIISSGVTVETLLTRGVDRRNFATIDTGSARTAGNVLAISGEKNGNNLSAALGWLWRYENGKMLWALKPSGYSAQVALSLIKKHPGLREELDWAQSVRPNPILRRFPVAILAFLRYAFKQHKPQKAVEFFDLIGDIMPDQLGSPTRLLRDWVLTNDQRKRPAASCDVMAVTVKCWTSFVTGSKRGHLSWRRGGDKPESFPPFPGDVESKGKALKIVKRVAH